MSKSKRPSPAVQAVLLAAATRIRRTASKTIGYIPGVCITLSEMEGEKYKFADIRRARELISATFNPKHYDGYWLSEKGLTHKQQVGRRILALQALANGDEFAIDYLTSKPVNKVLSGNYIDKYDHVTERKIND